MDIGFRIKTLRKEKGLTQTELAKQVNVSAQVISNWERGYTGIDHDDIQRLADVLNTTADYLLGRTDNSSRKLSAIKKELELLDIVENDGLKLLAGGRPITPKQRLDLIRALDNPNLLHVPKMSTIPILGQIKMGIPLLAEENYYGELEIPSDIHADFALEAHGDSMIGVGLLDGDYAICRQQSTAYSGDIVVALHDSGGFSEATLKYYFNSKERPILRAANPNFEDIPLDTNWRIAGVLIAIIRKEAPAYKIYNDYLVARDINMDKWQPVIERAFQLGIKPEQLINMLETMYQVMKVK
ncbi:S24 family peptidase [Peptococcaceae bacterium 1198_IL3148]